MTTLSHSQEHERVGTLVQFHILDLQAVDAPKRLVGIGYLDILQRHVLHLAEKLRTIDNTVSHHHVVAIPDG